MNDLISRNEVNKHLTFRINMKDSVKWMNKDMSSKEKCIRTFLNKLIIMVIKTFLTIV